MNDSAAVAVLLLGQQPPNSYLQWMSLSAMLLISTSSASCDIWVENKVVLGILCFITEARDEGGMVLMFQMTGVLRKCARLW